MPERPSPGQVLLLASVALALVGGVFIYRQAKGGMPFGLRADPSGAPRGPDGDPEPARLVPVPPSSARAPEPFPAGDAVAEQVRIQLGLFYGEPPAERPEDRLRAIRAKEYRSLVLVDRIDSFTASPALAVASPRIEDFPPPAADLVPFVGRGLSEAQKQALPQARSVLALGVLASRRDALPTLRDASLLAAAVAQETGAVICDRHTGECFSEGSWREQRIAGWVEGTPSLDHHVLIRSYKDGELHRAVTLGMDKFGLPDVTVQSFTGSASRVVASLINLTCQTLFERGRLDAPGRLMLDVDALRETDVKRALKEALLPNAQRKAEVRVAIGKRREGDPDNRLMEIVFPEPAGRGLAERQEQLYAILFGSSDAAAVVEHDEEVMAASRRARERLGRLEATFQRGLAPGERLLVKGPFKTRGGGNEWMWVEAVRWQAGTIRGVLMNDPVEVPGLKAGAEVELPIASVFDYIHTLPDGGTEGNETGAIMDRRTAPKK